MSSRSLQKLFEELAFIFYMLLHSKTCHLYK